MKTRILGILVTAFLFNAGHVDGAILTFSPTTDRTIDDTDHNGVFDSVRPDTFIAIGAVDYLMPSPGGESRFALEFDISSILSGPNIISAELHFTENRDVNFVNTTVPLYGYAGDGVITTSDATNLETLLFNDLSNGAVSSISIDVTSFISDLYNTNESFAGFLGLMTVGSNFDNTIYIINSNDASSGQPVLLINTVPIPAAAWLFGSGLLSLVGMARRKRS